MSTSTTLLIRFIDLGLLLLMAFLAIADLAPSVQVALPHGGGAGEVASVMRIQFNQDALIVQREPVGDILCQEISLKGLAECIRSLKRDPSPYLLTPVANATVQRLVHVMDVCKQERVACAISPLR